MHMNTKKDYYKILNIPSDANEEDITKAFHQASVECQPDKYSGSSPVLKRRLEKMLEEIKEAYEVLSKNRKQYDKVYLQNKHLEELNGASNYKEYLDSKESLTLDDIAPNFSQDKKPDFDKTYTMQEDEDELEDIIELALEMTLPITMKAPLPVSLKLYFAYGEEMKTSKGILTFDYGYSLYLPTIKLFTDKEKITFPRSAPFTYKIKEKYFMDIEIPMFPEIISLVRAGKATFRLEDRNTKHDITLSKENLYHIQRFYLEQIRPAIIKIGSEKL